MGKHLWRKHSHVRVEKEDPGCLWALFRILQHHRWYNVKRMLPYKKHKLHERTAKIKGNSNQHHEFIVPEELEEDVATISSASVSSKDSRYSLFSRKSNKARIKALTTEEENYNKLDLGQQTDELHAIEDDFIDLNPPTLVSLLKAYPKMISAANRVDENGNLKLETNKAENKDSKEQDYVGVLELFRVNQDLFLQVLQDNPFQKARLAKSGSFPAPNIQSKTFTFGRTPSKVEHKHNEVWPVMNEGHELRRAKSRRIGRSSSFNESAVRYGQLFESTSNSKIKKHLSRSLRFANEKEFRLSGDHNSTGRRSFREQLSLLETESNSSILSEAPQASLERLSISTSSEAPLAKLDSPTNFGGYNQIHDHGLASPPSDENRNSFVVESGHSNHVEEEIVQMTMAGDHDTNEDVDFEEDEIDNVECLIPEDGESIQHSKDLETEMEYCNEDLQYVKYVLDVIGLTSGDDQLGAWHSADQPLDPALFDGIEVCCPFEAETLNKDAKSMSSSHRKFLFDLVNEALVYIHERSNVCYPKPLSFSCHIRPMMKGKRRVVEEVWEFISEYISWRPELDQTLEIAVAHDLSESRSGWMNMQTDSELLALDLEEWILDDLLDELVFGDCLSLA